MLLEQPAPPPVTVQRASEGGGAEIERIWPRQVPPLQFQFRKGFLVTGTIQKPKRKPTLQLSYPLRIHIPIIGTVQGRIRGKLAVTGRITQPIQLTHKATGTIRPDLEREIQDLKYLISKKKQRRNE